MNKEQARKILQRWFDSPLTKFKAWTTPEGKSPQLDFFKAAATTKTRIFRSGNQVGKTTAGAVDVLRMALGQHPWCQFKPPMRIWCSGLDWDFGIGQVIWPAMRDIIPMEEVRGITFMRKQEPQLPLQIVFKNGSEITFKSADAGRKKYQGAPLHAVWLDEEHPQEIVEESRTRLIKNIGYFTCTLTPVMRSRWIQDIEREPGTELFRASMLEAARAGLLDLNAVKSFEESLPEKQRRVRVHGDFVSLEGMVYPSLNRDHHCASIQGPYLMANGAPIAPWPLPNKWRRYAAIDWGMSNPTAVVIGTEDPKNRRLIITKVYYSPGIRASEWARLLRSRLPRLAFPMISDHDAQARAECEAAGLATSTAQKDIDMGLEAVERALSQTCADGAPRLMFVEDKNTDRVLGRCDAHKLLWEMEGYHYPQAKDGRPDPIDRPVKKDDHACDALRYLIVSWERHSGGAPLPPRATVAWKGGRKKDDSLLRMPSDSANSEFMPWWRKESWDE